MYRKPKRKLTNVQWNLKLITLSQSVPGQLGKISSVFLLFSKYPQFALSSNSRLREKGGKGWKEKGEEGKGAQILPSLCKVWGITNKYLGCTVPLKYFFSSQKQFCLLLTTVINSPEGTSTYLNQVFLFKWMDVWVLDLTGSLKLQEQLLWKSCDSFWNVSWKYPGEERIQYSNLGPYLQNNQGQRNERLYCSTLLNIGPKECQITFTWSQNHDWLIQKYVEVNIR
jgi:hypothetical protein